MKRILFIVTSSTMNRFHKGLLPFLLFLSTSLFTQTFAWTRPAPMVTGTIAYRERQTTSPQLAARLVALEPRVSARVNGLIQETTERPSNAPKKRGKHRRKIPDDRLYGVLAVRPEGKSLF
ncbi:hypothetical protein [Spirosoma horti]